MGSYDPVAVRFGRRSHCAQLAPTRANLYTTTSHFVPLWTYPTPKLLHVKRNLGFFATRPIRTDPTQFLVGAGFSSPNNLGLLGRFRCGDFRTKPVRGQEPAVASRKSGCLRDMLPIDDGRLVSIFRDSGHGQAIRDDLRAGLGTLPEWMRVIVRELLRQTLATELAGHWRARLLGSPLMRSLWHSSNNCIRLYNELNSSSLRGGSR